MPTSARRRRRLAKRPSGSPIAARWTRRPGTLTAVCLRARTATGSACVVVCGNSEEHQRFSSCVERDGRQIRRLRPALERDGRGERSEPATTAIRTNPAWNPASPARDTSAVDTAATPAAPPTSRIVSTRPEAMPDDDSATPDSAPICTDGAHRPIATPADEERRQQVGHVVGVGRHARQPQHPERQQRQAGDEQLAHADRVRRAARR